VVVVAALVQAEVHIGEDTLVEAMVGIMDMAVEEEQQHLNLSYKGFSCHV
jgi:hypothetical protein